MANSIKSLICAAAAAHETSLYFPILINENLCRCTKSFYIYFQINAAQRQQSFPPNENKQKSVRTPLNMFAQIETIRAASSSIHQLILCTRLDEAYNLMTGALNFKPRAFICRIPRALFPTYAKSESELARQTFSTNFIDFRV